MLNETCQSFREGFEAGRRQDHAAACEGCRAWASEVESLRGFGANVPLPSGRQIRLKAIAGPGAEAVVPVLAGPLPQVPLPSDLMAKLYRIPSESRLASARRPIAAKSGEMVAASFLFATVLTLGLGHSLLSPANRPDLSTASRIAGMVMKDASSRGTRTLLGVGESIFDGCSSANRSLEKLLDGLSEPRRNSTSSPRNPGGGAESSPHPPSKQGKESPHGSRQTH